MQWNLRGYYARFPYLQNAVDNLKPDIICLQETFLKPNKNVKLRNYHCPPLRKDRTNRDGGGVLMFIQQNIPFIPIVFSTPLEITTAQIILPTLTITLCSLYLPPDFSLVDLLPNLDALLSAIPKPFIILTDANAHHPSWGSSCSDRRGESLNDWLNNNNLTLLNTTEPTYLSSSGSFTHIDLTIATPDVAPLFSWHVHHDSYDSDHFPIILDSSIHFSSNSPQRWQLVTANWDGFQKSLTLPSTFLSPTQACGAVTTSIIRATNKHISLSKNTGKTYPLSNCWWNADCTRAKHEKNKALTQYKNHLGDIQKWIAFKKARAFFRRTILTAQKTSWLCFLSSINSNTSSTEIWRKIRSMRGRSFSKAITLLHNGNSVAESAKVADILAQNFSRTNDAASSDPVFAAHKYACERCPIVFPINQNLWYNLEVYQYQYCCRYQYRYLSFG
jgi:hypothetical protein